MIDVATQMKRTALVAFMAVASGCSSPPERSADSTKPTEPLADSHFHISNYAFQGTTLRNLVDNYMSTGITRSVVMPLPLQQRWDSFEGYQANSGGDAFGPNYYIGPKSDLYYYAFADAMYAKEYLELPREYQERLDLMITGFNPMDRYAVQHLKRAILTYPGAFVGIGEFTIHKEVVSKKIAGEPISHTAAGDIPSDVHSADETMSLTSESLSSLLQEAGEIGLVATLHNDVYDSDVTHTGEVKALHPERNYEAELKSLCSTAPKTVTIWAHTGLGRFVKPTKNHLAIVGRVLDSCNNWLVDISWDIVQETILHPGSAMPSTEEWTAFLDKYQDRILWGSDTVIFGRNKFEALPGAGMTVTPGKLMATQDYKSVSNILDPVFATLSPQAAAKIKYENYVRVFNGARLKVRAWEQLHRDANVWDIKTPKTPDLRPQ